MYVQLLKRFYSEMSDLYSLDLAFLDMFPMACFITKAMPINIIDSASVELLCKLNENN